MFTTPIQRLQADFCRNSLYVKREDLIPLYLGGNKVRKAVLFFADLAEQDCDWVVTYGSESSNHCRVVANMAAAQGIGCTIITARGGEAGANRKLIELFGAQIIPCDVSAVGEVIEGALKTLVRSGKRPYFIPGGGHGKLGTEAYVSAYREICAFEADQGVHFDYIFCASGTGTTQAGLVCGQLLAGDEREIVGISIARKNPRGKGVVLAAIEEYLGGGGTLNPGGRLKFVDDYTLAGYGHYNDDILATIREVLCREGIPLDRIYTGKAFWGMKEYIGQNQIADKRILFIHTGGTPLFFDAILESAEGGMDYEHFGSKLRPEK